MKALLRPLAVTITLVINTVFTSAQVGIGTTSPNASSILDITSTSKGLLIPRMTQSQRTAISSPVVGLLVYQTDGTKGLYQYDGSWNMAGAGSTLYSTDGTLSGNRIVSAGGYTLTLSPQTTFNPSVTAASASAVGTNFTPTLTSVANNDVLVGVSVNPTFSNSYTNVGTYGMQVEGINFGRGAGSRVSNIAIGNGALIKNTTGINQVVIGYESGKAISNGVQNTIIGANSLTVASSGSSNTVVGAQNSNALTTGSNNCVIGTSSLSAATTGSTNIAIGLQVLLGLTTGSNNIALGNYAGNGVTNGQHNVSIGQLSLYYGNSSNNIGIGNRAGFNVSTGSGNTLIGHQADISDGSYSNSTALGNGASATQSNAIQLGNSSITLLRSQVSLTVASDRRLKERIMDTRYGLKDVMRLRPVDYVMSTNQLQQVGFIAQDVQAIVPEVVTGKEGDLSKGDILGITYEKLVPILTKAIQEQQVLIEQLKSEVEALKKRK